jgi:type I restriction enzyme R subunit
VDVLIQDTVFSLLPTPPFSDEEKQALARRVFEHVWQQSSGGLFGQAA